MKTIKTIMIDHTREIITLELGNGKWKEYKINKNISEVLKSEYWKENKLDENGKVTKRETK